MLLYFDGLVDRQEVETNLLKPLMLEMAMLCSQNDGLHDDVLEHVRYRILTMADLKDKRLQQHLPPYQSEIPSFLSTA